MTIKRYIPNSLTLLNLFCGCVAIVFIADNKFEMSFYFVSLGIFFDFFDGFFARRFNVSGLLGVQLDSLADMITSGLVPGFLMFKMLSNLHGLDENNFIPFAGFIITLGACYRLANFNIDTRQTDSFIGLPTPANTLFIMSLPLIANSFIYDFVINQWVLIAITLLSAYIMNAEIPLFSLKIKKLNFSDNKLQVLFLLFAILLLILFQFTGIALIIISYVLLSVITNKLLKK